MLLKKTLIVFFSFLCFKIYSQTSPSFKDAIKNPLFDTPAFNAASNDHKGYTDLMHTLIRWEATRSMYDVRFSGSTDQIKILSLITKSSYGMAMYRYFEGIRKGIGDPLNAENDFLYALEYFQAQKDTSGILHTTMHMLRLSLNTTMTEIGNMKRYTNLYNEVLQYKVLEPLDLISQIRIKLLYDDYINSPKTVSYHQKSIDKGLQIIDNLEDKYAYYKFLFINALGVLHSKNVLTKESEKYHLQAYEFMTKYEFPEKVATILRIATMKYTNGKYDEALNFLAVVKKDHKRFRVNSEIYAQVARIQSLCYFKKDDLNNAAKCYEYSYDLFNNVFFKNRHLLYMQDMAALHKNEQQLKTINAIEIKQAWLYFFLASSFFFIIALIYITIVRIQEQKNIQNEIVKRNFIYSLIGHDLSSPLMDTDIILNHIETDLDDQLDATQKNYINDLRQKTLGANQLLLNLLTLYKGNKNFMNESTVNIKEEANKSVHHLFNQKQNNVITIKNLCDENLRINIDANLFQCVIRNIVDNALKHSQSNVITIDAQNKNNNVIITIQDNGIGMHPDIVDLINKKTTFDAFKNKNIKIGLGIFFIHELIDTAQSSLKVESNLSGTTFEWTIPKSKSYRNQGFIMP